MRIYSPHPSAPQTPSPLEKANAPSTDGGFEKCKMTYSVTLSEVLTRSRMGLLW